MKKVCFLCAVLLIMCVTVTAKSAPANRPSIRLQDVPETWVSGYSEEVDYQTYGCVGQLVNIVLVDANGAGYVVAGNVTIHDGLQKVFVNLTGVPAGNYFMRITSLVTYADCGWVTVVSP